MGTASLTRTAAVSDSEILLGAARPDLFRLNAFRITGLSVDATSGDIAKQADLLRMAEKFGASARPPSPLPLQPPPDNDMIRAAVDRLRDPERRLVDEFFWFWPRTLGDSSRDPALLELARGRAQEAMNIWMQQEGYTNTSNVSMHNLAVLAHVTVLDLETQPVPVDVNLLGQYWSAAFLRWRALMDDEAFWDRLTARIREMDDPRLTTGTARRMRASLPVALLSINAQLAVRAAEAGKPAEAQRHLKVMTASGLAAPAVDMALARAVEPIRDRIKTHCQTAEREAEANVLGALESGHQLLERARPLLAVLDCMLPPGHPTRDGAHDDVALRVLQCGINFGNKTEKYREALALEEQAAVLAVSGSAKERIQRNVATYKENIAFVTCHFCGQNDGASDASIELKMHGNIQTQRTYNGIRTTWTTRTLAVPRCASCRDAQRRCQNWVAASVITCVLAGMGGCGAVADQSGGLAFIILLLFAVGGSIAGSLYFKNRFRKGVKPASAARAFPRAQELLKEGWRWGANPPNN